MDAPLIDKRKRQDIVAETEALAEAFTNKKWKPPAAGEVDAGRALAHIFARFAELGIERINRTPEKNLLAFLNLIGTELSPPRPARVPLTFVAAANSPLDASLPAGTQAAAPPLAGEEEELIFETERDLVVTRSQLQAVFVRDTETDRYSDRSQQALGQRDEAFAVFRGDQAIPHELYVACDALLTLQAHNKVTLALKTPDTWQWTTWPIEWSYWNGAIWERKDPAKTELKTGAWQVEFDKFPKLEPYSVNGVQAGWLRARLVLPLPPAKKGVVPESVANGRSSPKAPKFPLHPFGESATVTPFYLSADEAFQAGGAIAKLHVSLARKGKAAAKKPVSLKWSIKTGRSQWTELTQANSAFVDGTQALTASGEIQFRLPADWQRALHAGSTGRWLRIDIVVGEYAQVPQIATLTAGYAWELPRISAISLLQHDTMQSLLPEMAYNNNAALDLGKDYYPFGEQPRYNDTFYIACEQALAKANSRVTLRLKMVNPANASNPPVKKVLKAGNPDVKWEAWNGRSWETLTNNAAKKDPAKLTGDGDITLTLPASIAQTAFNGETRHWLRARIVGGNYGVEAQVQENAFVAATYAPPVVQSIEFIQDAKAGRKIPVSACLTNNDFAFLDHTAVATQPGGGSFPAFTVTEDTRPALYLGLDRPFDPRPMTLYLRAEPPLPEQVAADKLSNVDPATLAQLAWEYASPAGWMPLGALDQTQGLARRELVHFVGPDDFKVQQLFGKSLFWLRVRWQGGVFPLMPTLRRVLLNTTWAAQITSSRDEILGSGNGNAGQTFNTAQVPVQPGQQLQVRESEMPSPAEVLALQKLEGPDAITVTLDAAGHPEEVWVRWHAVADFYISGPRDRHYVVDAISGKLRFGDGKYGLLPGVGQNNIRISYRSGGGASGNRTVNTIVQLKSSVPYIDAVTNHEAAAGGAEQESLSRVKERGPRQLRHRDRSVTTQDLEDLAQEADVEVARVRAVAPGFEPNNLWLDLNRKNPALDAHAKVAAGRVGVVVVPGSKAARPAPSLSMLRRVKAYLLARCASTAEIWVAGPEWIKVTVEATVVPVSLAQADAVTRNITLTLNKFLHPLSGGPKGRGWAFGRIPLRSDIYAVIEAVANVDHVRSLTLSNEAHAGDGELKLKLDTRLNQSMAKTLAEPPTPELQQWLDRSLVYSGRHVVRAVLEST